MKTSGRWSSWQTGLVLAIPLMCLPAAGCAKDRASVEKNLAAHHSAQRREGVEENYRVGCPDLIELNLPQRPELSGRHEVGADGRIDLGDYGQPRVEGHTPPEIAKKMAADTGSPVDQVQVRVVEYRSAYVLLFGEVVGSQRSTTYRGPETVLDLLQRVGGITVGAEPKDVYVVRPHLGDSQRPEVYHVDLQAIVVKHDERTNLRILPYDQIYVGETRQAKVEKALPPWLRRVHQAIWDTRPADAQK